MHRTWTKWLSLGLVVVVLAGSTNTALARRGSRSAFNRYMQQQRNAQRQILQMEQRAMMEAMARQAAIEKQKRENLAKASKARHDKEEQHRQEMIDKRKAEQASKTTDSKK